MLKNLYFSIPRTDAADYTFQMIGVEGTGDAQATAQKPSFLDSLLGNAKNNDNAFRIQGTPIRLSSFYIGEYPVTQALWSAVVAAKPDYFAKLPKPIAARPSSFVGDALPVESVSWDDAQHFIKVLNDLTATARRTAGVGAFALPTEAQWEYTARGGIHHADNFTHAGCNAADLDRYAWYDGNNRRTTMPVGTRLPNQLGIYDMSGNVWEWCKDWYDDNFYKSPAAQELDPCNENIGRYRVLRGGSWSSTPRNAAAAIRFNGYPPDRFNSFGLRLVLLSL